MKYEDLNKKQREWFHSLRHGSSTVKCDMDDALEQATELADFKEQANAQMDALINEAISVKSDINVFFPEV